jgi:hypothetical protein
VVLLWVALTDFGLAGYALVNVLSEAVGRLLMVSKRRPGVSAPLRRVCILGAGHHRPNYWNGLYRRLPFHSLASRFPRVGCHLDPGTGVDLRFSTDIVCDQPTVKPVAIALQRSPGRLSGEYMGDRVRRRVAAWPCLPRSTISRAS